MNRIRTLRKEKGLTMKAFGAMFALSESTISLYENDKHYPDIETLQRFADFFGVTVDYLLGREEAQEKSTPASSAEAEARNTLLREVINDNEAAKDLLVFLSATAEERRRMIDYLAGVRDANK